MITLETLRAYGANVDEGLARCMNMEDFYIKLVKTLTANSQLNELEEAIRHGELDRAFELAHALKGIYANLSLTPLLTPVAEMTELLRSRTQADYSSLIEETKTQFEKLCAL